MRHAADSQGMAAPRASHDLLGQKWYLFWAKPMAMRMEWERHYLLTSQLYSLTSPSYLGFYFGLVLSSNKWSILGRRGDRDPKDPDGEHSPSHPPPSSCAPGPQGRPGFKSASPEVKLMSLDCLTASCLVLLPYSIWATCASSSFMPIPGAFSACGMLQLKWSSQVLVQ